MRFISFIGLELGRQPHVLAGQERTAEDRVGVEPAMIWPRLQQLARLGGGGAAGRR